MHAAGERVALRIRSYPRCQATSENSVEEFSRHVLATDNNDRRVRARLFAGSKYVSSNSLHNTSGRCLTR